MGKVGPLTEKPVPTAWTAKSLILQRRGLVRTTESVAVDPTETCPNERAVGLAVTGFTAHAGAQEAKRKNGVGGVAREGDSSAGPSNFLGSERHL